MIKADNTQKRCFVACDEQTKKDGRCSCHSNTHQAEQLPQDAVMQSVLKQNDCRYGNYIVYGGSITQLNEKEMCHFLDFLKLINQYH